MSEVVDLRTGQAVAACDEQRARDLTDKIKTSLGVAWELVKDAYRERAWAALGYRSWDEYVTEEFGANRFRLPREDRREVVGSLREAGMSIRAIAATTGASDQTVQRDLKAGVVNHYTSSESEPGEVVTETHRETTTRTTVTGTDGKTYPAAPASPPAKPRRAALPDLASDYGWKARKAIERLETIAHDDRLINNKEQVATNLRGHLLYTVEVCQDLLDRLD